MRFIDFFRKNMSNTPVSTEEFGQEENVMNENPTNEKDSSMVTIKYGTGMPIDLIYAFLQKDYESKGYEDALSNPEVSYKEMNKDIIRSKLEVKFRQVRLSYTDKLQKLDFHINSRREAGLIDFVKQLETEKSKLQEHVDRLDQMEKDFQNNVPYMIGMLLSYEKGFLKGLSAVSMEQMNMYVNDKED